MCEIETALLVSLFSS